MARAANPPEPTPTFWLGETQKSQGSARTISSSSSDKDVSFFVVLREIEAAQLLVVGNA